MVGSAGWRDKAIAIVRRAAAIRNRLGACGARLTLSWGAWDSSSWAGVSWKPTSVSYLAPISPGPRGIHCSISSTVRALALSASKAISAVKTSLAMICRLGSASATKKGALTRSLPAAGPRVARIGSANVTSTPPPWSPRS